MDTITQAFLTALEEASKRVDPQNFELQHIESIIEKKSYQFYFVHRQHQDYPKIRAYRKTIFANMQLNPDTPTIQFMGDSSSFDENRIDFARQFIGTILAKYKTHTVLYGMTGKTGDVNALISEWIAQSPENQARVIGCAVNIDTPRAIKEWHFNVGDVRIITVVYPGATFGSDVELSDNFVPESDTNPGDSLAVCMEGGVQTYLQAINMIHLGLKVFTVEKLRGLNNIANKIDDKYYLFFSATEFLNVIKKYIIRANEEGRQTTRDDIEKIRDAYLYNPQVHQAYDIEKYKHLRIFCDPAREEYSKKMSLFMIAFNKFCQYKLWNKLDLLISVNYEEEEKMQQLATSVAALKTMAEQSNSPILYHRRTPDSLEARILEEMQIS